MKVLVNKEELKREWILNKWYDKVIYVVGVISVVWIAVTFTLGFIIGFMGL